MTITYLKRAEPQSTTQREDVSRTVARMLADIESGGERAVKRIALQLDGWTGDIAVSAHRIAEAAEQVPDDVKRHIHYAHDNIRRFAEAQLGTISECKVDLQPGFTLGQRQIPISSAGCYVPGGRYSHIASAMMTIATAKVAGVKHIAAVSPPRGAEGIPADVLYTMHLCGADCILTLGGVQGIAAMANGLFGCKRADILVGPGNQYVAEAKRLLFGRVGIDMVAGPTDSLIIADSSADPELVAADLVGQAEHGYNSPVWLVTDHEPLAKAVMERVPSLIDTLPDSNRINASTAWRTCAEVVLCTDREEMASVSDDYAPEHLHVHARDLDWWLSTLSCYGSLFLGEQTTVAFGDKSAGPNLSLIHI